MNKFDVVFIFFIILASGCTPSEEAKQISIEQTQLAAVTNTSASTNTPAPTKTPAPTNTPQPTYTPMATDIPYVNRVIRDVNFNDLSFFEFDIVGDYELKDGLLILIDPINTGDPWADGSSDIWSQFSIKQGNGYLL
ncbi:MAG: hypothetical protein MUO42_03425, partial [Anaerolineaceae bacterium]|nr:hypothetical protein [Anaerolineaceae bacterium]